MTHVRKLGVYDPYARYGWQAPDHGLFAASCPPTTTTTNIIMPTAGRLEFVKLRLPSAASVTNVLLSLATAGATLTAGQNFAALYTSASVLVGVTADQAAGWAGATGVKTMALAGGPFSLVAGNYFVAFWYNGTTAPTWRVGASANSSLVNLGVSTPNLYCGTADTGLTTTAPGPMGAQTVSSTFWWAGLS